MYPKIAEGKADLHTHTTASDGLLSPAKLIEYAARKGVSAVAITDHDTTAGIEEAMTAGQTFQVDVLPGIELNTQMGDDEVHILGYFIKWNSSRFQHCLADMRDIRNNRAYKMVRNLVDLYGFDIAYEEVLRQAKDGTVGRPHIARVLVAKGFVNDVGEAFDQYIGSNCPAYVDRYRQTPEEGIRLIESVGGVPVLAHPGLLPNPSLMDDLICMPIKGIEAYHSKHTKEESHYYSILAKHHGLLITGGSDCHGELYNGMPIIGDVSVELEVIDSLRKLAKKVNKI